MAVNNTSVKKNNILEILKLCRTKGTVTKKELSEECGLTVVTVNNLVNELINADLVTEEGIATSNGGRKATLFRFNNKKYKIIGTMIRANMITVSLFNLNIDLLDSRKHCYNPKDYTVKDFIRVIRDLIEELTEENNITREEVAGMGVALPGLVDYERGIVYQLPNIHCFENVPFRELLEQETGYKVYIDNDNNCDVLTLKWKNVLKDRDNRVAVYLNTKEGIGSGILFNGEIYRGFRGVVGEFGHIMINSEGERCECGCVGCLELYASNIAIKRKMKQALEAGRCKILSELCQESEEPDFDKMIEAVKRGDTDAKEIFLEAAKYLGIGVVTILKTYAPMEIVIENDWLRELDGMFSYMLDYIYENVKFFNKYDLRITLNTIENIDIISPATIVLDSLFNDVDNKIFESLE